jgi:hypothetical protein
MLHRRLLLCLLLRLPEMLPPPPSMPPTTLGNAPPPPTFMPPTNPGNAPPPPLSIPPAVPTPVKAVKGVLVDGGGYLVAWAGGKPRPDWSRLAIPAQVNSNPKQLRRVGSKDVTPYNNRGLALKQSITMGETWIR